MLSPFYYFLFVYCHIHNDRVMIRVLKSKISCLNRVDGKIIRNDKSINHVVLEYTWVAVVAGKWAVNRNIRILPNLVMGRRSNITATIGSVTPSKIVFA